jgi:glycosyltransferase involved in cell wall biosynthesis
MSARSPDAGAPAGPRPGSSLHVANLCRVLWNGGVARSAIEQTDALRSLGVGCDLIFLRAASGVAYTLPQGTRVLEASAEGARGLVRSASQRITRWFAEHRGPDASVDLDLLWKARHQLRQYSAVIYNDQYAGLLGAWLRFVHGQPYVLMFLEFYPKESRGRGARLLRPLAEGLDRISILLAPSIVTTSSRVAVQIERFAPHRTYLARLGAPTPGPRAPSAERDRRSVFSITVWDRGRHPELFLELARAAPRFQFVVAGIWTDSDHYDEFRLAAGELPNLQVTGAISEERRANLMNASWLYLRVGYDESGPGMGGLEALAAGSIVVTNTGLGLSEIIVDGVNGFVVDRADAREVGAVLERIDALPQAELEQISSAAIALAVQNSWTAHAHVLTEAIRHATSRSRSARARPGLQPDHAADPNRAEATR